MDVTLAVLGLFESVVRGRHTHREVLTPRTEELLVEIVDIVSLKFASNKAAERIVDILEPLFYSKKT